MISDVIVVNAHTKTGIGATIYCAQWGTVVPNGQNWPETRFNKFVKSTDHTCACNDLTSFECEAQATGNGSYLNLQKLAWKTS